MRETRWVEVKEFGPSPDRHSIASRGKIISHYNASLHPGEQTGTGEVSARKPDEIRGVTLVE